MAKNKKMDKMYTIMDESNGYPFGPEFSSEKAAMTYIDKNGRMNTEYAIFYCEKVASANTKLKAIVSAH